MALGNPSQVGTNTAQTAAQTTLATASTCVIPAASLVVACVLNANASTDPGDPTQVSDGTNNYTKDAATVMAGTSGRVSVWSFYDTAGRTATVTATFPSSNMTWIYVFTLSSAASSAWVDTSGTSSQFSTAMAVTTAATIAQTDEVSFGVYGRTTTDAATTWPGAGYTSLVNDTNATRARGFMVEYKNQLTAGSTETAPGTLATNSNLGRIIVAYKGATAATFMPQRERIILQAVNQSSVY